MCRSETLDYPFRISHLWFPEKETLNSSGQSAGCQMPIGMVETYVKLRQHAGFLRKCCSETLYFRNIYGSTLQSLGSTGKGDGGAGGVGSVGVGVRRAFNKEIG